MKYNLTLKAENIEELTSILKLIEENNQSGVKVKLTPNNAPSTPDNNNLKEKIKDLIEKLAGINGLGKEKQVRNILNSFNANRFSEVNEKDYQNLYNLLKELSDVS